MKTIIRVIVLFLVVGAAGFGGYYILKGVKLPTFPEVENIVPFQIVGEGGIVGLVSEQKNSETAEETASETGNLVERVSGGAAFSYSVVSDSEIYYFAQDGRVFRVKQDGDEVVSDKTLNSLNGVWVTPDGKRGLVSFGDPKRPEWSIFDFLDAAWRPLPTSISYASWGENNDTLVAIEETNNTKNLVTVSLIKSAPVSSLISKNFGMADAIFTSAGKDKIFISEKPSSFYRGGVLELNTKTLDIKNVFPEEPGLLLKILPNASGIVKFSAPNKLSLATLSGLVKKDFLIKTIPDKCGGANNRFFCFVPTNIMENVFLPDDYFKNKVSFVDALYEINPGTGQDSVLFQSGVENIPAIDGENVFLVGERLYFINKYDKRIYRVNLTLLEKSENETE